MGRTLPAPIRDPVETLGSGVSGDFTSFLWGRLCEVLYGDQELFTMSSRRTSKSVRQNKKRGSKRQLAAVPRVSFIPAQRSILTYAAELALAEGTAGLGNFWFYRLNSVYDPDASGTGSVAIGYNTWATLFLSYKVHRCTFRLQGTVTGLSAGTFGTVILAPVPNQMVLPSNKQTWKVIPRAVVHTLTDTSVGGRNMVDFSRTYSLADVANVTKSQYANDMDFSGAVGSNPARQIYMAVTIDSTGSTSAPGLHANVQISYEVEWFNPVPMQ